MSQVFQLALINSQCFEVNVVHLARVDQTHGDDVVYLQRPALDDSGVISALRILEQVAAEGADWVRNARPCADQIIL